MLDNEAERLCEVLLGQPVASVSPLLNVGSSSGEFRTSVRPHIERKLFEPLRRRALDVTHFDLKQGEGIDVSGDILDGQLRHTLRQRGFRCVLLSNVLEHVRDRDAVARACEDMVGPGGLILASVPSSYPYHADPIDTLYRPTPETLAALFRDSDVLQAETLINQTYAEAIEASGSTLGGEIVRTLGWLSIAPARPRSFLSRAHRWFWYARPYAVSIALLRVR